MKHPTCGMCGDRLGDRRIESADFTYVVCPSCGAATLSTPTPDGYYESEYFRGGRPGGYADYTRDAHIHRRIASARLDALRLIDERPMVVDVGSAYGYTLGVAETRGWDSIGVEVSDHATREARGRGHRVVPDLGDIESGAANAVIFGQVLEHMAQPHEATLQAFRILKPGGRLFIETWDLESRTARRFGKRWQQISPPSVIHLFTTRSLDKLLQRIGFVDFVADAWQKPVGLGGYAGVIATKLPDPLATALMKTVRATRVDRVRITYRFDDLVAITATKPNP